MADAARRYFIALHRHFIGDASNSVFNSYWRIELKVKIRLGEVKVKTGLDKTRRFFAFDKMDASFD